MTQHPRPPLSAEHQLKLIADNVRDFAFITFDRDRRITSWSPGSEHIFGWTEAEMIGASGAAMFTPEDRDRNEPEAEFATAASAGRAQDERWHLRKDGSRLWASGVMTALREDPEGLVGFAKVLRDLTDRKRSDDRIRESEHRLQVAIDSALLGTWELDLQTYASSTRSLLHDQMFGYSEIQPDWNPAVAERHIVEEDKAAVRSAFQRAQSSGELRFHARVQSAEGALRWISVAGRVYDTDHRSAMGAGVVADITAQKRAEQDRERLRDLEHRILEGHLVAAGAELDRNKGELGNLAAQLLTVQEEERRRIARELHDDLAQRMAMLEIELDRLGQHVDAPRSELTAHIGRMRERISRLSLDVRRISHHLHPEALEHLGLNAALRSLIDDFSTRWPAPVDYAAVELPDRIPPAVVIAVYRIVQEAMNNIAKHAPGARVAVLLTGAGGTLELCIEDDGPGFDRREVLSKGTLGLISMRERVRLLHGTLSIDSTNGEGTTITVRVPLIAAAEE